MVTPNPPSSGISTGVPCVRRILITGRVQGVGFRPFVSRLAHELGIRGWVRNRSGEVEIHAEGTAQAVADFLAGLTERAPPLARPEAPRVAEATPEARLDFAILASTAGEQSDIHIPPDYFVCADCLAEMSDPAERRFRYPFINCTQCGPRWTLIDRLPYDRPNTAMANFPLCPACLKQYLDPADRRYHAQPLACPECGPRLCLRRPGEPDVVATDAALTTCLELLRQGLIIAVKGVGGYHLLCDAADAAAVARLRERKRRPHKPLAVLVPWAGADGLAQAEWLAELVRMEREWLCSPQRPIVLVRRRREARLAAAVAPGLAEIGLMLPYSPLHHLLAEGFGAPLVATSANLSGEPVLTDAAAVEARLGHVADACLHHDRPIRRPADDSVWRRNGGRLRPLRLGRGSAPVERTLPFRLEQPLLAAGSDLKNTVALAFDDRIVISPHTGDLGSVRGAEVFRQVIADLCRLYQVEPARLVVDAHPDYFSSRWAAEHGLPVQPVFHHHAHAAGLYGEFALAGDLLAFTWDGTGYGADGTIWGGEALLGRPGHWQRLASLRPFRLPGGDRAIREPWRSAAALCWEAGLDWPAAPAAAGLLRQAFDRRLNCPVASSAGRLFDAAAALLGLVQTASHEGQAGMVLEAVAADHAPAIALPLTRQPGEPWRADWAPLLPRLLDASRSVADRAGCFHASLAASLADQADRLRDEHGVHQVGLTGGVFQNRRLTELAIAALERRGFRVWVPEALPVNDGGLSYGQVIETAGQAGLFRVPAPR